jgi:hypothetical protein
MESTAGAIIVGIGLAAAIMLLVLRSRSKKSPKKQPRKMDSNQRTRIKTHLLELGQSKLWTLYEFIEKLSPENREREGAVVRAVCMRLKKGRNVAQGEVRALTRILREDLKMTSYSVALPPKKKKK